MRKWDDTGPCIVPFITSFCCHRNDDKYIRKNGLLSMWRSYGPGGGVALVLDRSKLEINIRLDTAKNAYLASPPEEVFYAKDNEENQKDNEENHKAFKEKFGPFVEAVKKIALPSLMGTGPKLDDLFCLYLECIARIKHQGFEEEREVRIVANLLNKRYFAPNLQKKKQELPPKDGKSRLVLFKGEGAPRLPIKEIIVGPHEEQTKHCEEIKKLTKHLPGIDVTCSVTPYIERK